MIKTENIQMKRKRIECNTHGAHVKYRCEHPNCSSPYVCAGEDCIDEHFHQDGKLAFTRFDSKLWQSKFQEVQNVLSNQTLKVKEEHLTRLVDFFTNSLRNIHMEMSKFQEVKGKICREETLKADPQYFQNINGFLSLSSKLERKLDHLRAKIIDEDINLDSPQPNNHVQEHIQIHESNNQSERSRTVSPNRKKVELEKSVAVLENRQQHQNCNREEESQLVKIPQKKNREYYENPELTAFLKKHIKRFQWSTAQVVFSSQSQLTTCERFHDKLKDRCRLLFLFFGENEVIGSFYSEAYPSTNEKFRKDVNSFIFVKDEDLEEKFAIFFADSRSESHMTVSQKLFICQGNTPNNGDGLRTFQRNFQSVAFFLPSISFAFGSDPQKIYNGVMKIKQFFILQLLS